MACAHIRKPGTFAQYRTLLGKDLRREFRTKEMLTAMGIYALLVLVVYGAALSQTSHQFDILQMAAGLLWALVVFTSLLGLNRSFAHEQENACLEGILLVPLDRSVVFLAKATSNFIFLVVVEVVVLPLFYFFFLTTTQPADAWPLIKADAETLLTDRDSMTGRIEDAGLDAKELPGCSEENWKALADVIDVLVPASSEY